MKANLTFVYDRKGQATRTNPAVVELRITGDKVRKYISTGVKLLPKEWSNGSVVGRKDWKELNDQLQIIKRKCSEIINGMLDEGGLDLNAVPQLLKNRLIQQQTFVDYAKGLAKRKYVGLAKGTINHYESMFHFLEGWGKLTYFSDLTERNIRLMDSELTARGLKQSTRWNYHKCLKFFILQALEDGFVKRNPYTHVDIKRGQDKGLSRFLTPNEFEAFKDCILPTECLRKVRDLFLFQTYTMMSYSDMAKFDYKDCEEVKGQMIYKSKRTKTKQDFTIVLLEPALAILKRYKYKLPIISNVKYNLYLKAAVTYAGIDKPVTTHWARHTGATMLLNEGKLPMHIIQHMLGHASIRETERTYAKLMDETIVEAMANYQNKLK